MTENALNLTAAIVLGLSMAGLNCLIGLRIKKSSLGKSLDQFFRLGFLWNAIRGALFLICILMFLQNNFVLIVPFLTSLGIAYFVFLSYEIFALVRA